MSRHSRGHTLTIDATASLGAWDPRVHALGQGGIDDVPLSAAVVARLKPLRPKVIRLFVQEYYRMYPARFSTLERAVDSILATGAVPLLSLCMKPRELYPRIDQDVTEPTSWAKWDAFIERLVKHFRRKRKPIGYWEVFNEPDIGELGGCPGRFSPGSYFEYYRHTVQAIRRADPRARVGGPALAYVHSPILPTLLRAAERESLPLDFVSYHVYGDDPAYFGYTVRWVKHLLAFHPALRAEVMLNEWNLSASVDRDMSEYRQAAFAAAAIAEMDDAGLDLGCFYHVMDMGCVRSKWKSWFSKPGLDTMDRIWNAPTKSLHMLTPSGEPRAPYALFHWLSHLPRERVRVTSSPGSPVGAIAARSQRGVKALLWNYSQRDSKPVRVALDVRGLKGRGTLHVLSREHPADRATGLATQEIPLPGGRSPWSFVMPADAIALVEIDRGSSAAIRRRRARAHR